jgi:hypothetical protein
MGGKRVSLPGCRASRGRDLLPDAAGGGGGHGVAKLEGVT